MIETKAPSLGIKPHKIKNTAPVARAVRFTIFVIDTSPTFWLKDVFGRTPNRAAKVEPRPSHTTPPESSSSVASRPMPPSVTPEISPTVSTAVTTNITRTGAMARQSNTIFTGISFGTANHAAFFTLSQLSTHAFVYSTPSALTAVCGSTIPIITAAIYPTIIPIKMEEELVIPFVPCFSAIMTTSTKSPKRRFSMDPKS